MVALLGQYAPTVQVLQSSILAALMAGKNVPIGHGFGVEEEDGQKKPAGHAWQVSLEEAPDAVEYVPAGQARQTEALVAASVMEYVPGEQDRQVDAESAPSAADQEPLLQFWYMYDPGMEQYEPVGQVRHCDNDEELLLDWYVPVGQGVGLTVPPLGQ